MSTSDQVPRHREEMRARGFRPIQVWVPDVTRPGFAEEARRQGALVDASDRGEDIIDWLNASRADR